MFRSLAPIFILILLFVLYHRAIVFLVLSVLVCIIYSRNCTILCSRTLLMMSYDHFLTRYDRHRVSYRPPSCDRLRPKKRLIHIVFIMDKATSVLDTLDACKLSDQKQIDETINQFFTKPSNLPEVASLAPRVK